MVLESIEKVDDYTIKMNLNGPTLAFPKTFITILQSFYIVISRAILSNNQLERSAFTLAELLRVKGSARRRDDFGKLVKMVNHYPIWMKLSTSRLTKMQPLQPYNPGRWTLCSSHVPVIGRHRKKIRI